MRTLQIHIRQNYSRINFLDEGCCTVAVNACVVLIGVHLRLAFSGQPISRTLWVMKKTFCAFFHEYYK